MKAPDFTVCENTVYSVKGLRSHFDINVCFEKANVVKDLWLETKERPSGQTKGVVWVRINGTLGKWESESRTFWSRVKVPWKKPEASWLDFARRGWKVDNRYFRTSPLRIVERNDRGLCTPPNQEPSERIPPCELGITSSAGLNTQCTL